MFRGRSVACCVKLFEDVGVSSQHRVGPCVAVVGIGSFHSAVMLMMLLISRHSAARVSSLFFLTPALSAIESAILFGERLSPLALWHSW
jgi:drug/metabolite transporter (DMT)-like permease